MTHSIDVPIHRHPPISCVPSVGSRLNRLRRQAGISPDEMAKLLRMDKSQYAWCEQNTAVLEEGRLARLATLYGVDLEYLQGTTNQPRKPPPPSSSPRSTTSFSMPAPGRWMSATPWWSG